MPYFYVCKWGSRVHTLPSVLLSIQHLYISIPYIPNNIAQCGDRHDECLILDATETSPVKMSTSYYDNVTPLPDPPSHASSYGKIRVTRIAENERHAFLPSDRTPGHAMPRSHPHILCVRMEAVGCKTPISSVRDRYSPSRSPLVGH